MMVKLRDEAEKPERPAAEEPEEGFKVQDRRHWAREDAGDGDEPEAPSTQPTIVDEYRRRAEAAEQQLHEYIDAHKRFKDDQERLQARLRRDVERRAEERFGNLVMPLLELVDDLDLALGHVDGVPEAEPLARGVAMARDRFLATLERHGVEAVDPAGDAFDPEQAEAMQVEPVDDPALDGKVVRTLRPGYRLGERVIRPARVAVGKLQS